MRVLFALLYDFVLLIVGGLGLPARLLARRRDRYLALELTGDPPWRIAGRALGWRRRHRPLGIASLRLFAKRIAWAERDRRVRGVVVKVEDFEGPSAKLAEVRRLLEQFRATGKEVVFYGRAVSMREYALMTCGTRIQLAPGGRLDLRGYAAELAVYGRLLDRFGVHAHFARREQYKTAPETFTDAEVSAPQRETAERLLSELYDDAVATIARGRKMSEERVRQLVDEGPYTAAGALAAGLVDGVGDSEDLEELLSRSPGKESGGPEARQQAGAEKAPDPERLPFEPLARYRGPFLIPRARFKRLRRRPLVAVVRLDGLIKLGENVQVPFSPRAAGCDSIASALRRAREDRRVRAVVFAIDSRGGSSLASELILKAVRRLGEEKPVVAYVDHVAASGGYMAAVGASHIVAAPAAIAGSIGVFGGKLEVSGLMAKLGVGRAVVRRGRNSAMLTPFEPFSDAERALLDREVEETYRDFLARVAEGRKRPVEAILPLAGGRIYTGRRAQEVGLVDEVGGFEQAVRRACALAGIRGEPDLLPIGAPGRTLRSFIDLAVAGPQGSLLAFSPNERVWALDLGVRISPEP